MFHAQRDYERTMLDKISAEGSKLSNAVYSGRVDAPEYLQQEAANKRVTLEKVRVCLRASRGKIMKLPRRDRLQKLKSGEQKVPLARTVIGIIWDDKTFWLLLIAYDDKSRQALCWVAVAEGLEDLLTRWLNVDTGRGDEIAPELRRWQGALFEAILVATFTQDVGNSAKRSLRYFSDMVRKKDEMVSAHRSQIQSNSQGVPPICRLRLLKATRIITSELCTGRYPNTYSKLWHHFYKFYRSWPPGIVAIPMLREFSLAVLNAYSPERQNPAHLLRLLRQHVDRAESQARLQAWREEISMNDESLERLMKHTQELLRQNNRPQEADWVKQQAAKIPSETHPSAHRPRRPKRNA